MKELWELNNIGKVYYDGKILILFVIKLGYHNNESTNIHGMNIPRIPSFERIGVYPERELISLKQKRKHSQIADSLGKRRYEERHVLSRNKLAEIK